MARKTYTFDSRQRLKDQGVNDAWLVKHQSVGKENSDESPYLLANEWICGSLGQYLRLPIPPFGFVKSASSKVMFISFRFRSKYSIPPDAMYERCFQRLPHLCTGILLFDILVANSDRHAGNLKVDDLFAPSEIEVFDHDRAFFGVFKDDGVKRLQELDNRLGVTGGPVTLGNRHCFLDEINTVDHLNYWLERIHVMADIFIRDVCDEAPGITQDEQTMGYQFLGSVVTLRCTEMKKSTPPKPDGVAG